MENCERLSTLFLQNAIKWCKNSGNHCRPILGTRINANIGLRIFACKSGLYYGKSHIGNVAG